MNTSEYKKYSISFKLPLKSIIITILKQTLLNFSVVTIVTHPTPAIQYQLMFMFILSTSVRSDQVVKS